MGTLWQDVKYGARGILRQPGFLAVVTLILALGIGANTAVFSYVSALFLAPLPVPAPDRIVRVFGSNPKAGNTDVFSYPDYLDLRDRNQVFDALAVHRYVTVSLNASVDPENAHGEMVSGNYFAMMGVHPVVGRTLTAEDDVAPGSYARAVISHGLWQRRFGGAADVVGRTLYLNGGAFTIVGVMPPEFRGSHPVEPADFWVPVMMYQQIRTGGARKADIYNRNWGWLSASGRMKAGVTLARACEDLRGVSLQLAQEHPKEMEGVTFVAYQARALPEEFQGGAKSVLGFSLLVTGVLLLVACANIAAMMLARAAQRNREVAIRISLGAGRGRMVRQWLTESLLWAVPGGVAGVLLSLWTTDALMGFVPRAMTDIVSEAHADTRVLGFALAATMLAGILVGLVPAWRAGRTDLNSTLKEGGAAGMGRHSRRVHGAFVVVQAAACMVLLVVAGLLLRSVRNSTTFQPGFRTDNLLLTSMDLGRHGYSDERGAAFYEQLREKLRALPGVENVSYAISVPLGFGKDSMGVKIPGHTPPAGRSAFSIAYNIVGPEYFATMNIPLVAGREFDEHDAQKGAQPVVIINETMARRFWTNENPVGQSLLIAGGPSAEIIGVARDITYYALGEPPRPFLYGSMRQFYDGSQIVHVRTRANAPAMAQALRGEMAALDANVAADLTITFAELRGLNLFPIRAMALVGSVFGALVLVLTALGLYGLVSYSVSQRTREIGIRMALGAQPNDVLVRELRSGMKQALAGLVAGLVAAAVTTHFLESQLFGLKPLDPLTYTTGTLLLVTVALVACWIPARRAARVDPMVALRYE